MSAPNSKSSHQYKIKTTWDGDTPSDKATIHLSFASQTSCPPSDRIPTDGLVIQVDAPFYNDPIVPPSPTGPPGSTDQLWNYEVVEIFFLGKDNKYLEIELAPKGHYLLLQLDGSRNVTRQSLPLDYYKTEITGDRWVGEAIIPYHYFPEKVQRINAYAIHKSDPARVYMALHPVPKGKYETPDFHRLEYFQPIDFTNLPTCSMKFL